MKGETDGFDEIKGFSDGVRDGTNEAKEGVNDGDMEGLTGEDTARTHCPQEDVPEFTRVPVVAL